MFEEHRATEPPRCSICGIGYAPRGSCEAAGVARGSKQAFLCLRPEQQGFSPPAVLHKKGALRLLFLWRIGDSNSRLSDCEPDALPTELIPHKSLRAALPDIRTAKIIKILTVFSLSRQSGRLLSYLLSLCRCTLPRSDRSRIRR